VFPLRTDTSSTPHGKALLVRRQLSETSCEFQYSSWETHSYSHSGIFAASWFQDRYGYIRTMQVSHILMASFIFIVFL
jgi:hypothetical protein